MLPLTKRELNFKNPWAFECCFPFQNRVSAHSCLGKILLAPEGKIFSPQHLSSFLQWKQKCSKDIDSSSPAWGGEFLHKKSSRLKKKMLMGFYAEFQCATACFMGEKKQKNNENIRKRKEDIIQQIMKCIPKRGQAWFFTAWAGLEWNDEGLYSMGPSSLLPSQIPHLRTCHSCSLEVFSWWRSHMHITKWYPYSNRVISVESYSNRSYRDTYFHLKHHHCRVKSNSIWVWWVWFSQTSETQILMCLQNEHSSWPENSLEGGVSLKECSGRLHILNESVAWTLIHLASIFLSSKPQRRAKCPLAGRSWGGLGTDIIHGCCHSSHWDSPFDSCAFWGHWSDFNRIVFSTGLTQQPTGRNYLGPLAN